jgi:hypothetical protein
MTQVVNRSRDKHAADAKKGAGDTPTTPPEPTKPAQTPSSGASPTPPAAPEGKKTDPPKLTDLLGNALRFGSKGAPKPPETTPATPPVAPPDPTQAAAAPKAEPAPPPAPKKAPKGGKKAPVVDAGAIAREAATAATEAALRTVHAQAPAVAPSALDNLTADDKRDYEVALHLAKIDPRYPDAPKVILEQVQRAEDYAARWEAANPGKAFDPQDEEHNEFYAALQRPWSDADFDDARVDMRAEKKLEKFRAEQNENMSKAQGDVARVELAPVVEEHFAVATMALAKLAGDDVHAAITSGGWDGLHKHDPVLAQVLGATLQQLHPFIEAAVQIDDPRARIRLDPKNPAHQQWNEVVRTGENSLIGSTLEDGRVFARRADYAKMTPAQQSQHWFLTRDMIIQGALDYAGNQVKAVTEEQKKRLEAMGFVRQGASAAAPAAPPATPTTPATPPTPPPPAPEKPTSPTVGTGAKIDDTAGGAKTKEGALMQQISGILFKK